LLEVYKGGKGPVVSFEKKKKKKKKEKKKKKTYSLILKIMK